MGNQCCASDQSKQTTDSMAPKLAGVTANKQRRKLESATKSNTESKISNQDPSLKDSFASSNYTGEDSFVTPNKH